MPSGFLPGTDAALLAWSNNFSTLISATPTAYGLTAAQATAYATLNTNYSDAYTTAIEPSTRTRPTIATKDAARAALKDEARRLAAFVQNTLGVTDAQKLALGLTVRATPSPIPAPATSPDIDIVSTSGRMVKIRLHVADVTKRGRPAGVDGASVFSFVGATPPADTSGWRFEANTSKTTLDVVFDAAVPSGATVWYTAFWIGTRMESGPACNPVSANIPGGMTMAA